MLPSGFPQLASMELKFKLGPGSSKIGTIASSVQPLTSVMVTLYVPEGSPINCSGELAFVKFKSPVILYGPCPPTHVSVMIPSLFPQLAF